jgi:hypothetical protein
MGTKTTDGRLTRIKKAPQDFTCDAIKGELSIPLFSFILFYSSLFSFILLGAKLRKTFESAKKREEKNHLPYI